MKRILYIWKDKYPWDVRVEKFCKSLARAGFEVLILCRWKVEKEPEVSIDGIKIKRVGFESFAVKSLPLSINPFWKKEIKSAINIFEPDLIICREFFLTALAKKESKHIPVIMDMAEHYPEAMKGWNKYKRNPFYWIMINWLKAAEYLERKAIEYSDGIIVISDELKNRLVNDFNYPEDKISIVHNTPDLSSFENVKNGSTNPPVKFAYHGYFSNDRNLDILVRSFILAAEENHHISLFMAGDGEPFAKIKRIISDASCSDKIKLFGSYEQLQLNDFLSETDVAILPYKTNKFINHIISNKLFDYMACGKPVIVSESVPMLRIINETKCGISADCSNIVDLKDKILFMADINTESFSQNGIEWSRKKYNWSVDFHVLLDFINGYVK